MPGGFGQNKDIITVGDQLDETVNDLPAFKEHITNMCETCENAVELHLYWGAEGVKDLKQPERIGDRPYTFDKWEGF